MTVCALVSDDGAMLPGNDNSFYILHHETGNRNLWFRIMKVNDAQLAPIELRA